MAYEQFLERIKTFLRLKSDADMEKAVGIRGGYLWKIKNGKIKEPSAIINWLISQGLNTDYFLTGDGAPELKSNQSSAITEEVAKRLIPYLDQFLYPELNVPPDDGRCKLILLPGSELYPELRAFKNLGDSMTPTIKDGDVVICDTQGYSGDGIYVIRTRGYIIVKRLVLHPDGFMISSDNNTYKPYIVDADKTDLVGRVLFALLKM